MKNKGILLLRTILLSTSRRNQIKYTTDKKKRSKLIGSTIGSLVLYLLLVAFGVFICIGYGQAGIIKSAPDICALTVSILAFFFTLFKTNGYLFYFKEYDMLMSLPFTPARIAACKFMYMYIKTMPWCISISLAVMIGYGIYEKPAFYIYPIWIILSFFLPVIPMLIATFLGFVIARISAGFRSNVIIQTVLIIILVIGIFASRFFVEDTIRNGKLEELMKTTSDITGSAAKVFFPAGWFTSSVTETDPLSILLLVGVSSALFALVFFIVGRSYRKINSAMGAHVASRSFRMSSLKKRSVVGTVAYKEFKRLTGSTTYMVNGAMGMILTFILGVLTVVLGFDRLISMVTRNAPFDHAILQPAIPFIIHFLCGMVSTTACSPSLEGKNYWIVLSLPIEKKKLYQGKMLFNMLLMAPFSLFGTLCMCLSAKAPLLDTVLYLVLAVALCGYASARGCVCGVKHMRLDWENEIEVIKQGSNIFFYLFPNMLLCMATAVGVVFLGIYVGNRLGTLIILAVVVLFTLLSYRKVMSLAKKDRF